MKRYRAKDLTSVALPKSIHREYRAHCERHQLRITHLTAEIIRKFLNGELIVRRSGKTYTPGEDNV